MSGREDLVVFLKGVAMGAADAVPGVSGGTIALITGIYERLIEAITAADPRVLGAVLRPRDAAARTRVRETLVAMQLRFLVALGLGIVSAILVATRVITWLLEAHRAPTYAFFFGLIGAAAIVLYNQVSLDTTEQRLVGLAGFLLAFVVAGLGEGALPSTLPIVFGAGVVAVTAMVLPGVSGSLFLLVLGQYEYMIEQLTQFVDAVIAVGGGGSVDGVAGPAVPVVTFLAGAVVGLLSVAHAIRWALHRYRAATLTFLVSLMVGALRKPIDELRAAPVVWDSVTLGIIIGAGLVGAILVIGLDLATDGIDY